MFCRNVEYMQIVVNGLKLAQPPVCSFFKGCSKDAEYHNSLHFGTAGGSLAHISTAKFNPSPSLAVTQLLSKAQLSAEPALSDAVEIVNPSVCAGGGSKS